MQSIIDSIVEWLTDLLVTGIMSNLTSTFDSVNAQVGQIATEVGMTPSAFSPAIFNMIKRNISILSALCAHMIMCTARVRSLR